MYQFDGMDCVEIGNALEIIQKTCHRAMFCDRCPLGYKAENSDELYLCNVSKRDPGSWELKDANDDGKLFKKEKGWNRREDD